jgi:hypothetical protein
MGSIPTISLPLLLALLLAACPRPFAAAESVCLLAPRARPSGSEGRATAVVPVPRPTVFAVGELESVRIERRGRPVWERRGSGTAPLRGPIAWPLSPIRPGERLMLRLRPRHAAADGFAAIELVGASARVLERNQALLSRLGKDPGAWRRAFDAALDQGDLTLAWALLFAFEGPSSPELDALRLEVYHRACDGPEGG